MLLIQKPRLSPNLACEIHSPSRETYEMGEIDVLTKCKYNTGMKFEWDEQKNNANIHKRGIDFIDAIEVFHHPMLTRLDTRYDYGENRWLASA